MKILALAAACLLAIPAPWYGRTRPPPPPPPPTQVWVNPAAGLESLAGLSAGLYNDHTLTKFACQLDPADDSACLPAPCPTQSMCLTVRWGSFADDSLDARYSPVMCSGGCYRAGVIEINPEGPMYTQIGTWTPYHHLRLMIQHFGLFVGLSAQPTCVGWMSAVTCPAEGFTAAEATYLAGW